MTFPLCCGIEVSCRACGPPAHREIGGGGWREVGRDRDGGREREREDGGRGLSRIHARGQRLTTKRFP